MARQRFVNQKGGIEDRPRKNVKKLEKSSWKTWKIQHFASAAFVIILSFAVCIYLRNLHLESLIITPLNAPKVIDDSVSRSRGFWGSYRPGLYFGIKSRSPRSPVMGLMWFAQKLVNNNLQIRHWCEQGDGLKKYGWIEHDGVNFGVGEIEDLNYSLTTTFVTSGGENGGGWTARISVSPKKGVQVPVSLLFYVALDGEGKLRSQLSEPSKTVSGDTKATGPFTVQFISDESKTLMSQHLSTQSPGLHRLTDTVLRNLAYFNTKVKSVKGLIGLSKPKDSNPTHEQDPNFVIYQITVNGSYEFEVTCKTHKAQRDLSGEDFTAKVKGLREDFDAKFEQVFGLRRKNYNESYVAFAKAVFSNLLGGIGYFYGSSTVQGTRNKEPVPYWEAPLYTAVPSRSFFPRGFLWDEGFHNLVIGRWDRGITLDILGHWMDLMNVEGWIPREQILGEESLSKVPGEFVVQRNTNANPPTFFLTLRELLLRSNTVHDTVDFDWSVSMRRLYPRLKTWFEWFNTTQTGLVSGSYRWRGRDTRDSKELNPKTLTSGLDDYPRASHPTDDERHLDLRCWMTMAAEVLADVAHLAGESNDQYLSTYNYLKDNKLMDTLHWSVELGTYADYGLHTDLVRLERPKPPKPQNPSSPTPDMVRVVAETPKLQFVNAFGYNSIFPLLLRIINPDSPNLGKLLTSIRDPNLLWTKYGLRSLAKNSPLYMQRNTEHDPPYWRGYIWLNVNYLAVTALNYYGRTEGPYRVQAKSVAQELKANLVENVHRVYRNSGYVWENYDDKTGDGHGCHPFTGWTSLVILIMAEE